MSVITNNLLLGDEGYFLTKSLRFRSSASAYLSRTPASAGNRQIWTWSGWIKRGILGGASNVIFNCYNTTSTTQTSFEFSNDTFGVFSNDSSTVNINLYTTQVFRDPSAWYHIVVAFDSTQATASNRVKIYINGSQVTAFSSSTYPSLNYNSHINTTSLHTTFATRTPSGLIDGYLAENNFIDGQALTPSSFGSTNAATGVWQPIKYSGTYGTNGFYLNFSDNSNNTATTIGKDYSGNGNNWTPNNISVTSGATYDSMTDVPTLTSATVANYCTINPLTSSSSSNSITNANLNCVLTNSGYIGSTFSPNSGKWYWEIVYSARSGGGDELGIGISPITPTLTTNWLNMFSYGVGYYGANSGSGAGYKYISGVGTSYGSTYTLNDVIGVALDLDSLSVTFYKNNVSQGAISLSSFTTATGWVPSLANGTGTYTQTFIANFGQRPFSYTPPTGYVALNTFNLPTPTIGATASSQANRYFDAALYTGTGSSQTISSLNFSPDFVWIKERSADRNHRLQDSVRGANKSLRSNGTQAEATDSADGYVSAFTSNGFTTAAGSNSILDVGESSGTYVAWCWDANGSGSTNTSGSITSTVSANTTAGFSIVTYTGTGSNATVGHGLGVAPAFIIGKSRSQSGWWICYHQNMAASPATGYLALQLTNAFTTQSTIWNNTAPTSSVFSLGSAGDLNTNGATNVAYCFAQVAGYSAFGSYTGNGSTDGTFVYTGFRPRFVMIKCSSSDQGGNAVWGMFDTARNTYNVANNRLYANGSVAENTSPWLDINSNGFKIRETSTSINGSSATYIYMAFAESPFKFSNAR